MNNIDPIQRDMFASFDATQVETSVKTPGLFFRVIHRKQN